MKKSVIQEIANILYKTDPAGTMSPNKDEYSSEAKIIAEKIEAEGGLMLSDLDGIFDVRFSGYYDFSMLQEAYTDIKDVIHRL